MIDESMEICRQQNAQQSSKKPQYKQIQNYVFSNQWKLGSGSFSQVFRGLDKRSNKPVAIKVMSLNKITNSVSQVLLKQEINILKQLDHQNVIKCFDIHCTPNNCYIITQFCQYGDLGHLLSIKKKFTQEEISPFIYHIYSGLKYLSQIQVIHRDFKVANIFVNGSGVCKIADFGFACKSAEEFKDVTLGSPIYMSPQAIMSRQYSPKTDIWAFGVLIFELICGKPPLTGVKSQQQIKQRILLAPPLINQVISPALRNFIQRCLTISPSNRISIQQMQSHEYIRKIILENKEKKLIKLNSLESSKIQQETINTLKTQKLICNAMQRPLSYQQACSLLQYCRLLSKVCSLLKSPILQQWLLRLIKDLNHTKLKEGLMLDYSKWYKTVSDYCERYYKEFKDRGLKVKIDDVLKQCQDLLTKDKKFKPQIMAIGSQTQLLRQALSHPLKLLIYAKNTKTSQYMK